jgi:putative ABC transport system permease protein
MLGKKALRDLWHLRGPVVAIALVVACGVGSFVAMGSMVPHLANAQARYYASARFADLWVPVKRAPRALLPALAEIPGVAEIEARVVGDVSLEVPGLWEPATGHLIGIPPGRPPAINRLIVRAGRLPESGHDAEVVISEGFARANRLGPGAVLGAVLNGRWQRLQVVGVVLTPEFVLEMRPGDLFPDSRRYGILWGNAAIVESAFGLRGAWNEAVVRLTADASTPAVLAAFDRQLASVGALGAYDRPLHPSHRFLSDEITQARRFAAVIPVIFLGVSAFLLNLVLVRLVATQREQIGMLKAFGCTTRELSVHYLQIAAGPVLLGLLIGISFGLWLAGRLALLYAVYYRIPDAPFVVSVPVLLAVAGFTLGSAVIGGLGAVRRVIRLPAAEAMRPELPPHYRSGLIDRLPLMGHLSPGSRLIVRGLERRPIRAILAVLGMAFGVAIMVLGRYTFDSIRVLRDIQFTAVRREDLAMTFTAPRGGDALRELARRHDVLHVEPLWAVPVRLRHGTLEQRVALTGMPPDAALRRVVDGQRQVYRMPESGLLLSATLARLLRLAIGDTVTVEVLAGTRPVVRRPVAALIEDLVGLGAYVPVQTLAQMLGASAIDGAVLRTASSDLGALQRALRDLPGVSSVASRSTMVANFDQVMRESFGVTFTTLLSFAFVLSLGVMYNSARIALAERERELASLRVLGFTRHEVAHLLFGELALLGLAAIPTGFAIGWLLCWIMASVLSSELFRLPLLVRPGTLATAASTLLIAGVVSSLLVKRRLDRLDLIAVLKTRE